MDWGSARFGEALRDGRVRARLTQRELAERAGVSVRAVRYIEQGQVERPRRESVRRLAEAVGLTVEAGSPAFQRQVDRLWLGVLGRFEVRLGERPVDVGPLKQRCLLALLALQPNKVVSHEEIVDVLWGDRPPESCQNLVHTYVSRLRKAIKPELLISAPHGGYVLRADGDQLDLLRFDELAGRAREAHGQDPQSAPGLFEQALQRWRAPLLADLPVGMRELPVARAASIRRLSLAMEYAELTLGLGRRQERVVEELRPLACHEPLHEALHARLMLALAGSGQQAAALKLFTEIRGRLAEELGIEPGAEISAAHLEIVRQQVPIVSTVQSEKIESQQVPAQLPTDVAGFVGRSEYLDQLDGILREAGRDGDAAVVISAIAGTAGVGKTALAVHWAHRVRDRYPDGQLYVNLRGYAPGPPVRPLEALTRFLHALGVPAERVPADEDEAASLYRTRLADRRALIVLDNAASADQVRTLLPGSPRCLVMVTSRDRLAGLVATEGAHRLTLDMLDPEDARALLARVVGEDRVRAEPDAVAELGRTCAHLPLALRIAGANLTAAPYTSISDYADELRERGRLTGLTIDGDAAVRAAFDLSYAKLEPATRRLFRLLGLVPGPDFTPDAAAALVASTVFDAKRLLGQLEAAHLVHQHVAGRYQFHDLLREYAHDLATGDGAEEVRIATERLLYFYLCTADGATRLLYPYVLRLPVPSATNGSHATVLTTDRAAIDWLESERANIVAAAVNASNHGLHSFAWRIADTLRGYFLSRGHGGEGIAICNAALTAAKFLRNKEGEATVHDVLGVIHYNLGNFRQVVVCHTNALKLNRRTGNRAAEATSLHNLGRAHSNLGQPARAVRHHERALEIYKQIGTRNGEANALNYVGAATLSLGQTGRAYTASARALELSRQIGDRDVEARSLHSLGVVHSMFGQLDRAFNCYSDCLAIARAIGNLPGEAITVICLADINCDAGKYQEAEAQAHMGIKQGHEVGDRRVETWGLEVLATVYHRFGDHEAADRHHSEALQLAREIGFFYGETSVLTRLSAVRRCTGRLDDAATLCQDALALIRDTGMRLFEGRALTELAHAYLELGNLDQAAIDSEHALQVLRGRKQRLLEARALYVLGLVRQAKGDVDSARSHWRAALEIFTDIGTPEASEVREQLGIYLRART